MTTIRPLRRTALIVVVTLFAISGTTGIANAAAPAAATTFVAANGDLCHSAPHSTGATAACVHPMEVATAKTASRSASVRPNVTIAVPSQCGMAAGGYTIPFPDRFTSCAGYNPGIATYLTYSDGTEVQTGEYDWSAYQWMQTTGTSDDPTWSHGALLQGTNAWGVFATGIGLQVRSRCHFQIGTCAVDDAYYDDTLTNTIAPGGSFSNEWLESDTGPASQTANQVDILDGSIGVQYTWPGTTYGGYTYPPVVFDDSTGYINPPIAIRCDSVVGAIGCVDEQFVPTVTYNSTTNRLVAPVAQHVYTAQTGGLRTAWGVPPTVRANGHTLTRDMNPADQAANNRTACGAVVSPRGYSCDEFPLESTHEGAAFNADYSTAVVLASANSSQGGITGQFYLTNRVIDPDPFYVKAILPTGAASW